MLDMKKLYYLDAIYRNRSFTKASEELYVSQPAISAAIAAFEDEVGVKLLLRSSKGVEFTVEGEQLMFRVNKIIKEAKLAESELRDFSSNWNQTLRFGISTTLAFNMLRFLYDKFFPLWPDANISIDEAPMINHLEKIRNGILDVSYNALPKNKDGLEMEKITTTQVFAIMRKDHPLATSNPLMIEDLHGVEVALPGELSRIREVIMDEFRKKEVTPHAISQHDQIICMLQMVKYGHSVGFINEMDGYINRNIETDFAVRPLYDELHVDIGFIMRSKKELPKIGKELISSVKAHSSDWLIS